MAPIPILYFANPMCSWCWGFAPVMHRIADAYGDRVTITVALGSLGDRSRPMAERDKATVREHWEHVHERTGQPFDMGFFAREGFVYDTEPACRAIVAVRAAAPERALPYLHRLQEAFYAHGRDIREPAVLAEQAAAVGIDPESLLAALASPDLAHAVRAEFAHTAQLGVSGYPTLLGLAPGRPELLSLGCQPLADVTARLDALLAGADAAAGSTPAH